MAMFIGPDGKEIQVPDNKTPTATTREPSLSDRIRDELQKPQVDAATAMGITGVTGAVIAGGETAADLGLAAGATVAGASLGIAAVGAGLAYEAVKHKKELEEAGKKVEHTAEHVLESAKNFIENHL